MVLWCRCRYRNGSCLIGNRNGQLPDWEQKQNKTYMYHKLTNSQAHAAMTSKVSTSDMSAANILQSGQDSFLSPTFSPILLHHALSSQCMTMPTMPDCKSVTPQHQNPLKLFSQVFGISQSTLVARKSAKSIK
jgi:hypothetical protein